MGGKLWLRSESGKGGTFGVTLENIRIYSVDALPLVLTDMWMPEMNGSEQPAKIRTDRRFDEISVVAVTAGTEVRNDIGFDAVLLKPISFDKVMQILTKIGKNV